MEQTSDSGILIAAIIITVLLLPISTTFVRRFSVDQRSLTNLFHILSSFSLGTGLKWRAAGRTVQHPQQVPDRRVFHTSWCWEPASVYPHIVPLRSHNHTHPSTLFGNFIFTPCKKSAPHSQAVSLIL